MAWYKEGSITLEQNSKKVIGSGTKWTNPLIGICSGQMLILKTQNTIEIYEIASVQSDTELTLAKQYDGETKSGLDYEIPTVPKVSIEALALRISEMLNYYQQQMEGWQTALTGEGEVTVTAPDGGVVTIKSQYSIQKELIQLVEQSKDFASSANKSSATATEAASIAVTSSNEANRYADNARDSATESSQSATNSATSATEAKASETNAQSFADEAKASADKAKEWASTVDNSNFIQKNGNEKQCINGQLDVNLLTENGDRVYSPNNKPTPDIIGALPSIRSVVNGVPTYSVGDHVEFEKTLTVGGKSVITDLTDVDNKIELINTELSNTRNQINTLNNRIYVVESYCDGYSWYRVYSDGFIVQSSTALIGIPNANVVCGTLINLLKPMRTLHYGVSIDKLYSGAWGMNAFSSSELYQSSFWLAAYSTIACDGWIRWTVQGY
ncbi:hypothetical protein [Gilliamella sp. W8128]|uniref:hypothetical protein n=1 Tax=Gilliamella sp. W8128 TaxID=2751010 RepID=UPI0018DD4E11|nr:hypothetical protein [Gilliamella sp. W8128]MBI0154098.1 hypothetical protein [Gilliamella sp. W8128]